MTYSLFVEHIIQYYLYQNSVILTHLLNLFFYFFEMLSEKNLIFTSDYFNVDLVKILLDIW